MGFSCSSFRAAGIAAALVTSALWPTALSAQSDGTPIRIQSTAKPRKWVTGRAAGITADSVAIVPNKSRDTLRFGKSELHRMDVSVGQKSDAGPMAAEGALFFGGLGLTLGLACASAGDPCGPGDVAAATTIGAAGGAALGALIGSFSHHERWETVRLGPHVSARLQGRRGVGPTVEF